MSRVQSCQLSLRTEKAFKDGEEDDCDSGSHAILVGSNGINLANLHGAFEQYFCLGRTSCRGSW